MEIMDAMTFALKYAPEMPWQKRNQEEEPETAEAVPDDYAKADAMISEAVAAWEAARQQAEAAEEQLRKIREQLEQLRKIREQMEQLDEMMCGGTSDV